MAGTNDPIRRLVLIGVGLIGGSLARALKLRGAVGEVVGVARTAETLDAARSLGVIDSAETVPARAVRGADIVVIATPVRTMEGILEQIAPELGADTVLTDVGSVKCYVVDLVRRRAPHRIGRFVPGHPIAGTERSGVQASFPELFHDRHVVLTPVAETDSDALEAVSAMWKLTGADVLYMDVDRHDQLLAITSHLPHVAAYSLVNYVAEHPESATLLDLAAGGFYDFTRIASSDAVMWRDICLTNRQPLLDALDGYRAWIDRMVEAIERGDGERLHEWFDRAKRCRDNGLVRKGKSRDG